MPAIAPEHPVDHIILGIDPGTLVMGYGILYIQGREIKMIDAGHLSLRAADPHLLRLQKIFTFTQELIHQHQPDQMAIEAPFFAKNVQSLLKLGRAQGAAIAAALNHSVPVFEYLPKKIKHSVTGNGNASKQQVAAMLCTLLRVPTDGLKADATDALGAAFCHLMQQKPDQPARQSVHSPSGKTSSSKTKKAWAQFLQSHPERQR